MDTLSFSGGVDFDELTPVDEGKISTRYKIAPRAASPARILTFEEVGTSETDRGTIKNLVNKILGEAETPTIKTLDKEPIISRITALRESVSSVKLNVETPEPSYMTLDPEDAVAQKARERDTVNNANETARLKALITAVREEGVATQTAISEMAWLLNNELNANRSVLTGIFNRKAGREDKFQQALLTTQLQQEAYAQEVLAVSRQSLRLAHEIGLQVIHNTSLPDILKSTSKERTFILDEEDAYEIKQALLQGHFKENLKDLNKIGTRKIMKGAQGLLNKANDLGTNPDGTKRTRAGVLKESALNAISSKIDTYKFRRETGNGRIMSGLYGFGDSVMDAGHGAKRGFGAIGNALSAGREAIRGKTIGEMLSSGANGLGHHIFNKEGFVRRAVVNPLIDAGQGAAGAIEDAFGDGEDRANEAKLKSITVTIPDHLAKISETLVDIQTKMKCVCNDDTPSPELPPLLPAPALSPLPQLTSDQSPPPLLLTSDQPGSSPTPNLPTVRSPTQRQNPDYHRVALAHAADENDIVDQRPPPRDINPRPAGYSSNVQRGQARQYANRTIDLDTSAYRTAADTTAQQADIVSRSMVINPRPTGNTRSADDIGHAISDAMEHHKISDASEVSEKLDGVVKASSNLMMFPEYRKVARLLNEASKDKYIPKEQAVLVDRATEQVALLASMSKKLDALSPSDTGGLFGGKGGLMGMLGGAAAGSIGSSLLRGGAMGLLRLVPLMFTPPGMVITGLIAAYLGREKIAELFSDVSDEFIENIATPAKDMYNSVVDKTAGLLGIETDHAKEVALAEKQAELLGVKPVAPEEPSEGGKPGLVERISTNMFGASEDELDKHQVDSGDLESSYASDSPDVPKLTQIARYTGPLKNAGGEAYYLPDIDPNTVVTGNPEHIKRMAMMNRAVLGNFLGMAFEYNQKTGNKLIVNQSVRTYAEQEHFYKTLAKGMAAKPGHSAHEKLFALDISAKQNKALAECETSGLMRKYGFWRPIVGELHHIEPIGLQPVYRKILHEGDDVASYEGQIMGGRGYGGGGSALTGKRYPSRSDELYRLIIANGTSVVTATSAPGEQTPAGDPAATPTPTVLEDGKTVGTGTAGAQTAATLPPPPPGPFGGANGPPPPPGPFGGMNGAVQPGGSTTESGKGGYQDSPAGDTKSSSGPVGDKALYVVKAMMKKGWSKEAAVGIAANVEQESTFNHKAVNDGAYGLGQWRGQRRNKDFQSVIGKRIEDSTFDEQLAYIDHELRNGEKTDTGVYQQKGITAYTAGQLLRQAKTAEDASEAFVLNFERPGNDGKEVPKRRGLAKDLYAKLNGTTLPDTGTAVAATGGPAPKISAARAQELAWQAERNANPNSKGSYYDYGHTSSSPTTSPSGPVPKVAQSAAAPAAAPPSNGFVKASYSETPKSQPATPQQTNVAPQPQVLDKPEVKAVLDKSLAVQTATLEEMKKLNALLASKLTTPSQQGASIAKQVNDPVRQSSNIPVKQNSVGSIDRVNVRI